MVPWSSQGGHSAQVKMRLLVNGLSLSVTQMGPDFVLVELPVNHAPAVADLVLQVDQSERRWNVRLPSGISANKKRVEIATCA
jgi:hypothetical protein